MITRRHRPEEISLRCAAIERATICPAEAFADLVEALHGGNILTATNLAQILGPTFDVTETEERDGRETTV